MNPASLMLSPTLAMPGGPAYSSANGGTASAGLYMSQPFAVGADASSGGDAHGNMQFVIAAVVLAAVVVVMMKK